ncbi:COG1470 family protein [[Eubacterium] cellulosolvens]
MIRLRLIGFCLITFLIVTFFPISIANAGQEIINVQAQETVTVGVRFPVILQIRYDFTNQENVEIWCGIRDSDRKYMVTPDDPPVLVSGTGKFQWNLQLRAPVQAGEWHLEAYLFHIDENDQEIIDHSLSFSVNVLPFYEPYVEITKIQSEPTDLKLIAGREASLMVSIRYYNLSSEYVWSLRAVIRDGVTGEDLGEVHSDPLPPGDGEYTFPNMVIPPRRVGEWPIQLGIGIKDCPTGLCGIQEFLIKEKFTITVEEGNDSIITPEPTSTKFDFSITLTPTQKILKAGGHSSFYIDIKLQDGESKEVMLYLNDLPQDWNYFFDPQKGKPDFKSELIIYLPTNLEADSYQLIITAKGENMEKQSKLELKVEPDGSVATTTTEYTPSPTIPEVDHKEKDDNLTMLYIIILISVIIIASGLVFFYSRKEHEGEKTAS